jgi:hypothetical protein
MFKGRHQFDQRYIDAGSRPRKRYASFWLHVAGKMFRPGITYGTNRQEGKAAAGKRKLLKQPSFSDLR